MPPLPRDELGQFERTYCECDRCVAACHHMPGMLAPGDIERIGLQCGIEPGDQSLDWVLEHFQASEGAAVIIKGKQARIPTIVPRLNNSGCVFLEHGKCTVHPAAPFGCRMFNVCDGQETADDATARSSAALACVAGDQGYLTLWQMLMIEKKETLPLVDRRENLQRAIDMIENEEEAE